MQTTKAWWIWRNSPQSLQTVPQNVASCIKTLAGSEIMMILKTHLLKVEIRASRKLAE